MHSVIYIVYMSATIMAALAVLPAPPSIFNTVGSTDAPLYVHTPVYAHTRAHGAVCNAHMQRHTHRRTRIADWGRVAHTNKGIQIEQALGK